MAPCHRGVRHATKICRTGLFGILSFLLSTAILYGGQIHPSIKTAAPEIYYLKRNTEQADFKELEQAHKSFQSQDFDRCLALLKKSKDKYPNLPPPRLMLARFFLSKKRVREGVQLLETVAAKEPDYPGVYLTFGAVALAEKRVSDALAHFKISISLAESGSWSKQQEDGFLVGAYAGLATVSELRQDWPSANKFLGKWLNLNPQTPKARQRLARTLIYLGREEEAYENLEQAAQSDKSLEFPAVALAQFYAQKGDFDRSREWITKAVKLAPKNPTVLRAYALWLVEQGKPREALNYANASANHGADETQIMIIRGLIARYLKEYSRAEQYFANVHRESPANIHVANQLVLVLIEQDNNDKRLRALQLAQMAMKVHPKSPETSATLAWVYYRLGRMDDAERLARRAVSAGTATTESSYHLAVILLNRGRRDDAKALLTAIATSPLKGGAFRSEVSQLLEELKE